MQFRVQLFGPAFDLFSIALLQSGVQTPDICANQIVTLRVENIALVTQIFLGVTQQQFAVFDVARREHGNLSLFLLLLLFLRLLVFGFDKEKEHEHE